MRICLTTLFKNVNPLDGKQWECRPFNAHEINSSSQEPSDMPWNELQSYALETGPYGELQRAFHISRIKKFVIEGVPQQDNHPIKIGANDQGKILVYEGYHRLCAAMLRGDIALEVRDDSSLLNIPSLVISS